jgi:hypothetical protein
MEKSWMEKVEREGEMFFLYARLPAPALLFIDMYALARIAL